MGSTMPACRIGACGEVAAEVQCRLQRLTECAPNNESTPAAEGAARGGTDEVIGRRGTDKRMV